MIGLDTNILARYYIQDEADVEAEKQHKSARKLVESGEPLMVCKTVILEFEWVMRGYYQFTCSDVSAVFQHLLSLEHIMVEDHASMLRAIANFELGFDFADALHHASYTNCTSVASFDDKKFARRAKRNGLMPSVIVPK
ncbi:type II toxin-antitoxin system VapC family toxin [Methyloprofundus sp.]|uniref:type II toxin-antitoxin system VapC family toxin n=1 Tax=Methyloprofundus sp. TaxID=2020875 RepID=UPI003D0A3510